MPEGMQLTALQLNFQGIFTARKLKETVLQLNNWQKSTAPELNK